MGADLTGAQITRTTFHNPVDLTSDQLYSTASYRERDLQELRLLGMDIAGWDFRGQDLTWAAFFGSNLTDALFDQAHIAGANLGATGFTSSQLYSTASYQDRNLGSVYLDGDMTGWDFRQQNLTRASMLKSTLAGANFEAAVLEDVNFAAADLAGASLDGANLSGANLSSANLAGASISETSFSSATLYNELTVFPPEFDPVRAGLTFVESAGDFDGHWGLEAGDLTALGAKIRGGAIRESWWPTEAFDLNGDQRVDLLDQDVWVVDLKQTRYGDTDLSNTVNFADFLTLSARFGQQGDWSEGDFDANGMVDLADFLLLSSNFGFSPFAAVPEPRGNAIGAGALVFWLFRGRKQHHRLTHP